MKHFSNQEIARVLFEIGQYLEMQDVVFKPQAYERVSEVIGGMREQIADVYQEGGRRALLDISGIGEGIADVIEELFKKGRSSYYAQLKKKTPVRLSELMSIEGLGPKSIKRLYKELNIRTLKDLQRAAKKGKIRTLEGFGEKSEENILRGIAFVRRSTGRFLLGNASLDVQRIVELLKAVRGVEAVMLSGSLRRRKETVGDADILVISAVPAVVVRSFSSMKEVIRVYAKGTTRSSVKIRSGMNIDLRVVPKKSAGAALNYFTGSKEHNVALRTVAIQKGYKLNEYGLFSVKTGRQVAGKTEQEIYEKLGMQYIEPEMRENNGEIECAQKNALPRLIGYGGILGDLQVQTTWTDGADSIEEMASAAIRHGLEYIAITDHTKRLAMTNGLDEKRLRKQMEEIRRLNALFRKKRIQFRILSGTECDILKDGRLDLSDDILSELDVVGISVHSLFHLSEKEQTERIITAMSNPHADILFHPTGRIIQKREAYALDVNAVIAAAKKTGTVLEANASPERLDLNGEHIRKCIHAGVRLAISSDAHSSEHFSYLDYGVAQARRGWARKKDIINAWPAEKMLKMLKGGAR